MTNPLHIGLVNNMPDAALDSTERQFRAVLGAASAASGVDFRLSLIHLPGVSRSAAIARRLDRFYLPVEQLADAQLDALIVTGAEPMASRLDAEPYWPALSNLVEWAAENTYSTIWSCLAAHAAVLQLSRISRRPLGEKLFGVYQASIASDHPLTKSLGKQIPVPHSRWNTLAEEDLAADGYQVLTRSEQAGVDTFVQQRKSLFVFFQGHPEYNGDTLALEYRRDIRRFLRGERDSYPQMPYGCLDAAETARAEEFRRLAMEYREESTLADLPHGLGARLEPDWRASTVALYRNWLSIVAAARPRHQEASMKSAAVGASALGL